MALTPRQQEIQTLRDKGLSPREVATKLDLSVNSIYQHIRRMKAAERKAARKTSPQPSAAPPSKFEPRPMTPLQAIRLRKGTIETEVQVSAKARDTSAAAASRARSEHDKLVAKRKTELAQLAAAELALTRKRTARKREPAKDSTVPKVGSPAEPLTIVTVPDPGKDAA